MATFKKKFIRGLPAQAGFTLIELLVVISIIGMLASVVLVSLNSAKQKGSTGAGLEFAATNYHALGASALGVWDFNDATASGWNSARNISPSGNSYALIPSSGSFSRSTITPGGSGYSLALTLGGTKAITSFPDTSIANATLSAWVYFTSLPTGGNAEIVGLPFSDGGEQYQLYYDSLAGGFSCYADVIDGNNSKGAPFPANVKINTWYHVACSFNTSKDNNSYINGYLNGSLVVTATGAVQPAPADPVNAIQVGGAAPGAQFNGYVDDAAVYTSALQ